MIDSTKRRGSTYITVLMTAMTVTIIATAGLAVARIQFRNGQATSDIVQARLFAQSAIEIGLYSINSSVGWRTQYGHDTWTPKRGIGSGAIRWKIVDDVDGDLITRSAGPFRLVGQGLMGEAIRTYSVQVESSANTPNLIKNPGIESDLWGWEQQGTCTLSTKGSQPHGGMLLLNVKARGDALAGPAQNLLKELQNGQAYVVSVWARALTGTVSVQVNLNLQDSLGGNNDIVVPGTLVGLTWTQVSGTITPTWAGTLTRAMFAVHTTTGTDSFDIDDTVFVPQGTNPAPMAVLPETWRLELNP